MDYRIVFVDGGTKEYPTLRAAEFARADSFGLGKMKIQRRERLAGRICWYDVSPPSEPTGIGIKN